MSARRRYRVRSTLLALATFFLAHRVVAQEPASSGAAAAQPNPPAAPSPQAAVTPASGTSAAAAFGEITGMVKSGAVPLPGVTVSASNTLTGKKYITSTDPDGSFKIAVGGKGRYVVRAEFSAFAPLTQEIVINDQNRSGKADLAMTLLSRAQKEAQQEQRQQIAQQVAAAAGRPGMQQLALSAGESESNGAGVPESNNAASLAGAGLPNAGLAAEGGNESVA